MFSGKVVMTQIDRRIVSEVLQVPVLGKSPDRQTEHTEWIAPQGAQGRFFCNLIGAFDVRFRPLASEGRDGPLRNAGRFSPSTL